MCADEKIKKIVLKYLPVPGWQVIKSFKSQVKTVIKKGGAPFISVLIKRGSLLFQIPTQLAIW